MFTNFFYIYLFYPVLKSDVNWHDVLTINAFIVWGLPSCIVQGTNFFLINISCRVITTDTKKIRSMSVPDSIYCHCCGISEQLANE